MDAVGLILTGRCYCGCLQQTKGRSFFVPGHDRKAETAVIRLEYGGVAEFLVKHGYGPGGKNAAEELEKLRERERAGE